MDDRYSKVEITSHTGARLDAIPVSTGKELIEHLVSLDYEFDLVAVDEAFMIDGVADVLIQLFKMGKTIVVASIEMSVSCSHFDEILLMMPWATEIEKCPAVCTQCQADAFYTHSKIELGEDQLQVGGSNIYEPRCWQCHSYTNERDT
jgi:thymidine kinase